METRDNADKVQENLDKLKNKIVNQALVAVTIIACLIHALSYFRAVEQYGLTTFIIQSIAVLGLIISSLLHKRISLITKLTILFLIVTLTILSGIYTYGIFAGGKLYIILIPVFFSFLIHYRNNIIILAFYMAIFLTFGYFYSTGRINYSFDTLLFAQDMKMWLHDSLIIILTSWSLLYVSHSFSKELTSNYKRIEHQNSVLKKYQNHLEDLVAERTNELQKANEDLVEKSQIIIEQNEELKATMQHLKETQVHLIETEKMASLGVLTAGVSHEINNPLNYIMGGYVGLETYFEKKGQMNNKKISVLMNSIKTGIDRTAGIEKGLNQFSRENESLSETCDIHSIIDNCLLMMQHQLKNRIVVDKFYSNESVTIKGNVGKLHQVFTNILINSSYAIEKEGSIVIQTHKKGNNVITQISDTGCGIEKKNISRITEPFFTTKDPGEGTGLGLSITYTIIREHNGKIEFESEINQGTTVTISLPQNRKL